MNIVIIGGSGFIGTHLTARLIELGHRVVIFDKATSSAYPERVILGDVCDVAAVSRALINAECVVNLAAEHRDDIHPRSRYYDVNVGGAENVINVAAANNVQRIVFTSTVAVYGLDQPCVDESGDITPFNDYGRSKAEAERVYERWAAGDVKRSLLILRPVVVFGEGNRGNVFNLIEQIRRDRLMMIGDGANRKSMAYVGNLVDCICARLDVSPGIQLFNYADPPDFSTSELITLICSLLPHARVPKFALPFWCALTIGHVCDGIARIAGKPFVISSVRVRKFCANTQVSSAALDRTGFKRRFSIAQGLAKMIGAINAEKDSITTSRGTVRVKPDSDEI
ncbi:NAD(P)-dependent oxidoreductase [Pseudolysobacter antarcticus]|uniref:NAD(P)-dependent oxidoreductase n=1 Tax=Pseudolysobacter antarcticus TaxID=2511995 RepID=A0A411HP78_9GAMM|nr:NAD(P)-dependent oxidoreductase [Pseudolysobacter antarcticus]QBB72276.1 NAD(P)-dependent oxidoreductase [Pseudolysobacter antarcticus]